MTGLARITSIMFPVWLTATVCQSSYPLNSENASPFGTCTVYLSCAEMALPPKTASTTAMITVSQDGILVMLIPPLRLQVKFSSVRSNGAGAARDVQFLD